MRVLFCGSRYWTDEAFVNDVIKDLKRDGLKEIIEGGARGADRCAHVCAVNNGIKVRRVNADWDAYGKRAGHVRNQAMLDMDPDVFFAFKADFDPNMKRGGTEHMVKIATKKGVPGVVYTSRTTFIDYGFLS